MADTRNVIEFIFRAVDQLSGPLGKMRNALTGALGGLFSFRGALTGAGIGVALTALVRNISEAEDANLQLANALKLAGASARISASQVDEYSAQLQSSSTFSDEAAKSAATLAIRLGLTSDTITRTVQAAADLAAATGGDLVSSTQQLSRALADPERGMMFLRRAGVILSATQRELVKDLIETGKRAEAQGVILAAVEARYRGAADAATHSLGGALRQLNNVIGDLFEGEQGGFSGLAGSINNLSDALQDPDFREGMDFVLSFLAGAATISVKTIGKFGELAAAMRNLGTEYEDFMRRAVRFGLTSGGMNNFDEVLGLDLRGDALPKTQFERGALGRSRAQRAASEGVLDDELQAQLQTFYQDVLPQLAQESYEIVGELHREYLDEMAGRLKDEEILEIKKNQSITQSMKEFYDALDEATMTSAEKRERDLANMRVDLQLLVQAGRINEAEAKKRLSEFGRDVYTMAEQVRAVMEGVAQDIQASFAQAFRLDGSGRDFLKNLFDAIRNTMAQIAAIVAIEVLGINRLLNSIGNKAGSAGGNSGFGIADALSVLGNAILGKATGGPVEPGRLYKTAEEGAELILPRKAAYVMSNSRLMQMLAGAGGGQVVFAPSTNVTLQSGGEDERRLVMYELDKRDARIMRAFEETLRRNGLTKVR